MRSTLEAVHVYVEPAYPSRLFSTLAAGMSIAEIVDAYPSLSEESVRGVLVELAHRPDLQPA